MLEEQSALHQPNWLNIEAVHVALKSDHELMIRLLVEHLNVDEETACMLIIVENLG